ncbi:hypothetical protein AGR4B_Cc60297 [Agrobacterium tumefaciens str. CFBP 5621]|nr:hypothetical protein AGR4B_Cc60297 [Agrobacterium tumefaciens str. CFBP 5621]
MSPASAASLASTKAMWFSTPLPSPSTTTTAPGRPMSTPPRTHCRTRPSSITTSWTTDYPCSRTLVSPAPRRGGFRVDYSTQELAILARFPLPDRMPLAYLRRANHQGSMRARP